MKVRVRGGYVLNYRNSLYKSKDILDMTEDEYKQLHLVLDPVKEGTSKKEAVVAEDKVEVPQVAAMDMQANRAILKPTRTRGKK
jgi:hypothetical protein